MGSLEEQDCTELEFFQSLYNSRWSGAPEMRSRAGNEGQGVHKEAIQREMEPGFYGGDFSKVWLTWLGKRPVENFTS